MKSVIGSICLLGLLSSCNFKPTVRGNEGSLEPKTEAGEEAIASDPEVSFEGITFRYDPHVFGDVKKEVVPESKLEDPTFKPDGVAPEHVLFEFDYGKEFNRGQLAVYPLNEFESVYAVSPQMVDYIKDEIVGLRKVLKDPSYRLTGGIPRLEYRDASDDVYAKVRKFSFPGGNGIIFVAHWNFENDLMSNRKLIYRFEGLTSDGKFYVSATTPVSVAFLPDDSPTEFEGYTYENLFNENSNSKKGAERIRKYKEGIATRLEKLNPNDYSPNLEKFEAMISSLKIDK